MQKYPPELMYSNINPKGFFSTFKQWIIQPIGNGGGYYWPGQNLKILIQSVINGVMDPYRSHIQITVQCDQTTFPIGILQVDSSAQSFIQQLVISSRNRQIQRIPQYGVLAAWLTDIGLPQMYAQGRQTQGLGYINVDSFNTHGTPNYTGNSMIIKSGDNLVDSGINVRGNGLVRPTQTSGFVPRYSAVGAPYSQLQPKFMASKLANGHFSYANNCWVDQTQYSWVNTMKGWPANTNVTNASILQFGYLNNLRAQYLQSMQSTRYADSTTSSPTYQIHLNDLFVDRTTNTTQSAIYQPGDVYKPFVPTQLQTLQPLGRTPTNVDRGFYTQKLPNTTNLHGYSSLYSANFCKGTHQPFISPTVPQCQMMYGKILPKKVPIRRRTFKIPLISAIIGLLIPQDQFVLLPIKGLNQLLIQIVLDRFAMFTSGYIDVSQLDTVGIKSMQARAFGVKHMTYNMHTYQFYQPQIDQYLNKSLMERILLNCNMWTLGNQYTIPKGQNVTNNWTVACTSQALNQIVILFMPTDYMHYSFCRKHFRLSNNITKFQLRINMQYFPPQPILGNGGNPCQIQGLDDNSNFIQYIYWSNNFMFNKVNPMPRINAYNFAINQRCYDPSRTQPFYDPDMKSNPLYKFTNKSVNSDTAMGMAWIHENRFVGKAGYTYSFQPFAHSAYHMVGLDCRNVRQFDVLLTAGSQGSFQRQQHMYIFTRSSTIVEFTQKGINVYGR